MSTHKLLIAGPAVEIWYLRGPTDACEAEEYAAGVQQIVRARFLALVKQYAREGRLSNQSHGHFLKKPYADIFEFKPRSGRVFGFRNGRAMYLTNGADKAKPKKQQTDYDRASTLRGWFLAGCPPRQRSGGDRHPRSS